MRVIWFLVLLKPPLSRRLTTSTRQHIVVIFKPPFISLWSYLNHHLRELPFYRRHQLLTKLGIVLGIVTSPVQDFVAILKSPFNRRSWLFLSFWFVVIPKLLDLKRTFSYY